MATINNSLEHDLRTIEMNQFMESGIGVKGLIDSGMTKLPRIFIHPPQTLPQPQNTDIQLQVPIIDFNGIENPNRRKEIVSEIYGAAAKWGMFQIVNHGVPITIMENMLDGVRRFNEQPMAAKIEWKKQCGPGTEQANLRTYYTTSIPVTDWRDSFVYKFLDGKVDEEVIPQICRKDASEYLKFMISLKGMLSCLFSEALGLKSDYLETIKCLKSVSQVGHYHPACPEPELTIGTRSHTDPLFFNILLQDNIGGLQVFHENHWVDVSYVPGSLIIFFGDLMQLIANDKFKSVRHRVVAKEVGPRVSSAIFFSPASDMLNEEYEPLKELVSEENPPIYRATTTSAYTEYHKARLVQGDLSTLSHFKLSS